MSAVLLVALTLLAAGQLDAAGETTLTSRSQLFYSFKEPMRNGSPLERSIVLDVMNQILQKASEQALGRSLVAPLPELTEDAFEGRDLELMVPMVAMSPRLARELVQSISINPFTGLAKRIIFRGMMVPVEGNPRMMRAFMSPGLAPMFYGDTTMCFVPNQKQELIPCSSVG